jgi:hypothetical protein
MYFWIMEIAKMAERLLIPNPLVLIFLELPIRKSVTASVRVISK